MEDKDIFRIIEKPSYQIRITQEAGKISSKTVKVEVELDSGRRFVANFFTLDKIYQIFEERKISGKYGGGLYFWAPGLILVKELDEGVIITIIDDIINLSDFDYALSEVLDED